MWFWETQTWIVLTSENIRFLKRNENFTKTFLEHILVTLYFKVSLFRCNYIFNVTEYMD